MGNLSAVGCQGGQGLPVAYMYAPCIFGEKGSGGTSMVLNIRIGQQQVG